MHCYLFDVRGDLLLDFPRTLTAPEEPLPEESVAAYQRQKQQREFYACLGDSRAKQFRQLCRSPKETTVSDLVSDAVPSLLFLPAGEYEGIFASRYASQLLKTDDPLPGEVAYTLGQEILRQLRDRFPNHHLIPALAFHTTAELYHATSPLLTLVPQTVRDMLAVLEENAEPLCYPALQTYYREIYVTDVPPMLDLFPLLTQLQNNIQASPLFAGLTTTLALPDSAPEIAWVRCPMSAFLYIYLLLSHTAAALSKDRTARLSLAPWEKGVLLTFRAASPWLPGCKNPAAFAVENELYSLLRQCPSYAGILTLAQYFLHKHGIPFTCALTKDELVITLTMKTAAQDTIEFHSGDLAAQLEQALPAAFGLLSSLLA